MKPSLVFLLFALLLSACDEKAFIQKITPKDDDALARQFINLVAAGQYADAVPLLAPNLRSASAKGLGTIHAILDHGQPLSIEIVGCHINYYSDAQGSSRRTTLAYEIHYPNAWANGDVVILHRGNTAQIIGSHFYPSPDSLAVINRFTLRDKSPLQYAVLAGCIIIPIFTLTALIICIRSRVRRKWLWIIFILFGIVAIRTDWTTEGWDIQPLTILFFGASAVANSSSSPWILSCAIPLGALIFLLQRRKILLPPKT